MPGPRQSGQSLVLVLVVCSILALLVGTVLRQSLSTGQGTGRDARGDVALQAADAGVSRYVARLVADPRYWTRRVDQAEDTRIDPTDADREYPPGSAWPSNKTTWTYATPTWRQIQSSAERFGAAEYGLRITPPPLNSDLVTIRATGRVGAAGANPRVRSVQAQVRPTSLADFQAVSDASISYGSTAVTEGKIYSANDVRHDGVARAPVYAVNRVTGNSTFEGGRFDSTTPRTTQQLYPSGVPFSSFANDLTDIEAAALAQGNRFDAADARGWLVQPVANGRINVWKITSVPLGEELASVTTMAGMVDCASATTWSRATSNYILMWFAQPVVVGTGTNPCGAGALDSVVDGRITIGTAGDAIVGGNIAYETDGDDTLGIIARDDVIIARHAPSTMSWRAATLAQSGVWRTYPGNPLPFPLGYPDGSKTSMTFTGSQAMYLGGAAGMFQTRRYVYDETLIYQRPPLYPTIEGTWQTKYWREVNPAT